MFGRKHHRRSTNPLFAIFRLFLSCLMLAVLLGAIYSAYKHFSGVDPLKIDLQSLVLGIMAKNRNIGEIINKIPGMKGKWPASRSEEVGGGKLDKEVGSSLGEATPRMGEAGKNQDIKLQNLTSHISPTSKPVFKFLLVADSHNDNANLRKAIAETKQSYPDLVFIIGLGDYTEVGTIDELKKAKKEFDLSALRYFLLPGDHDLWDSRDKSNDPITNFRTIFGHSYQSFTHLGFKFILLYNSDNYVGISDEQIKWLTAELEKAKQDQAKGIFVFVHEPLYHPSSDHIMGRVEKNIKLQAKNIVYQFKEAGVSKIFAGDIHYFSEYNEPETNLNMVTVGAITSDRNPQAPRYAVVSVFDDGNTRVEDVEVK